MAGRPPLPPLSIPVVDQNGQCTRQWYEFFKAADAFFRAPELPRLTLAQIAANYPATLRPGAVLICTDEAGGEVPVFNTTTDTRRVTDRAVAS